MNMEEVRFYCLAKPYVTEEFPFDESTLVFKVAGKMFMAAGLDDPEPRINLKCDPEEAVQLRESYHGVIPGWHMNKKHWNPVYLFRDVNADLIKELIDHSYTLVVHGMSKKKRASLGL